MAPLLICDLVDTMIGIPYLALSSNSSCNRVFEKDIVSLTLT